MADFGKIVTTNDFYYRCISDKIRAYANTDKKYTPFDMPSGVNEVYQNGVFDGMESGFNSGIEEGKQEEKDRFWDAYQENGNRTNYRYVFAGAGWTDETYNPKYPIVAEYRSSTGQTGVIFAHSQITDIKVPITLRSTTTSPNYNQIFYYAAQLVTVPLLTFEGDFTHNNANFQGARLLANITFGGSITQSGLNLSYCENLTVDSILSLFDCLADYSADTSGTSHAVTLGTTNLNKLTDAQKAIATQKGWTLA